MVNNSLDGTVQHYTDALPFVINTTINPNPPVVRFLADGSPRAPAIASTKRILADAADRSSGRGSASSTFLIASDVTRLWL